MWSFNPFTGKLQQLKDLVWGKIKGTLSDQTDLQTALDAKLSTETDPIFTASQASNITTGDITNLSNLSGINTGDQDLSGLVPYTGATSALDLGVNDFTTEGNINGKMYYDAIVDAGGKGKYLTVHEATAGEAAGASIFIKNGTYVENATIVVKNGQKIVGESREGVIINLNGGYQILVQGTSSVRFTGILLDSFSITGATTYGIHQIYLHYVDKSIIRNVKSYWATNASRPHGIYLNYSDYNLLDGVIVENGHSNFFLMHSNYNKLIGCSSFTPAYENYNVEYSAFNTFVGGLAKGSGVGCYMRYTSNNNNFLSMTSDGVSNVIAMYNSPSRTLLSGIIAVNISGVPIGEWLGTATDLFLENSYLEGNVTIKGSGFHISNVTITGSLIIDTTADGTTITNSTFGSLTDNGINTKLINNNASGVVNKISDIGNIGIGTTTPSYKTHIVGTLGFNPGLSVDPVNNGDVVIEATNDTTLTFKLKGSDGVVRSGTITLS